MIKPIGEAAKSQLLDNIDDETVMVALKCITPTLG